MNYYTQDNTQGYSDEEVDALHRELEALLAAQGPDLMPDERERIIKQHNDDVAWR